VSRIIESIVSSRRATVIIIEEPARKSHQPQPKRSDVHHGRRVYTAWP
jgi:hypothetical protein